MKKKIELIIFDLDGTLVDTSRDIIAAVNFMLKRLGLSQKKTEEIISYVGRGVTDLIDKALSPNHLELRDRGFVLFRQYYKEHPADYTRLYPGVRDILDYFKDKKKAVITNRNHNSSLTILKRLGIYSYFSEIIGDDNTSCLKPSRCQFEKLMSRHAVKNRQEIIMIGDMDVDIMAGRASGVITCVATYGFGRIKDLKRAEPDYIIDDILRLKQIVL